MSKNIFDVLNSNVIDYKSPIDCECDINAFGTYDFENLPNYFKNALSTINSMIELDYIQISENGIMSFSNSGIDYLYRNQYDFINLVKNNNIDFGIFNNLINDIRNSKPSIDYVKRFNQNNSNYKTFDDGISYDNIIFAKNLEEDELQG